MTDCGVVGVWVGLLAMVDSDGWTEGALDRPLVGSSVVGWGDGTGTGAAVVGLSVMRKRVTVGPALGTAVAIEVWVGLLVAGRGLGVVG